MKIFPTLYKKTSKGAIQEWSICVVLESELIPPDGGSEPLFPTLVTSFGQKDGKIQVTRDTIKEGKNLGKKNETNAIEQALSEAQSRWEKQKKKGYVETIDAAKAGEVDELIEGGINPMLAQPYKKHAAKITFPAYVQPKLDGIRCIAILKDGKCTLWSRTRKQINSMPHIVKEIEDVFKEQDVILDGELYNHDYKANFEHIVSLVRQDEPDARHTDVQYHIYDIVKEGSFEDRAARGLISANPVPFTYLRFVSTFVVDSEDKAMEFYGLWREQGYEGAMIRNANGLYENKRSYGLQKIKEFDEEEFDIIGVDEGRGKLAGHVGAFICRMGDGKEFLAKMSGSVENLKKYFDDSSTWKGKRLTVQYQGLTGAGGVPRFPVGKAIRDYE